MRSKINAEYFVETCIYVILIFYPVYRANKFDLFQRASNDTQETTFRKTNDESLSDSSQRTLKPVQMYTLFHTPFLVTHERLPFGTAKQRRVIEIPLVVGLVDTLSTPSLESCQSSMLQIVIKLTGPTWGQCTLIHILAQERSRWIMKTHNRVNRG